MEKACGLNAYETIELSQMLVARGRVDMLQQLMQDRKLHCSEALGDILAPCDGKMALEVYVRAQSRDKAVSMMLANRQWRLVAACCRRTGYEANWEAILRQTCAGGDGEEALKLARLLAGSSDGGGGVDDGCEEEMAVLDGLGVEKGRMGERGDGQGGRMAVGAAIYELLEGRHIKQATGLALEMLANDSSNGHLQTQLLDLNLRHCPPVADAILLNKLMTFFDEPHIARQCEQAGLARRALELFSHTEDRMRVLVNYRYNMDGESDDVGWLTEYFGKLQAEESLRCLEAMLRADAARHVATAVSVSIAYHAQMGGGGALVELFERSRCLEGQYRYLSAVAAKSEDKEEMFAHIRARVNAGQLQEAQQIVETNSGAVPCQETQGSTMEREEPSSGNSEGSELHDEEQRCRDKQ
jgi:clathrin heavy chain